MIYIILTIVLIILIFYIINNLILSKIKEYFNLIEYQDIMVANNEKKLFKIGFNDNIKIYEEDCFDKCDLANCIKLNDRTTLLDKCLKCNAEENKCFTKNVVGGNCDDCKNIKDEDKLDCYDINNFGCPNPKNIDLNKGIKPYYIQINDTNPSSPYDKKCVFCWNIQNEI
jgi:hypothetical protein